MDENVTNLIYKREIWHRHILYMVFTENAKKDYRSRNLGKIVITLTALRTFQCFIPRSKEHFTGYLMIYNTSLLRLNSYDYNWSFQDDDTFDY